MELHFICFLLKNRFLLQSLSTKWILSHYEHYFHMKTLNLIIFCVKKELPCHPIFLSAKWIYYMYFPYVSYLFSSIFQAYAKMNLYVVLSSYLSHQFCDTRANYFHSNESLASLTCVSPRLFPTDWPFSWDFLEIPSVLRLLCTRPMIFFYFEQHFYRFNLIFIFRNKFWNLQ